MKYYFIAGEPSGDLHGANLIRHLKLTDPFAEIYAWGGDKMKAEGINLRKHYRDLSFMGFGELVAHAGKIIGNVRFFRKDILQFKPDAVILIDYPGFNLRMASWLRQKKFQVIYYISPKIWAWNQSRILSIKKYVDKMIVIFPFEIDFYKRFSYPVHFFGNPVKDEIMQFKPDPEFRKKNNLDEKPIIAVLPGSRKQEIQHHLPMIMSLQKDFSGYQFVIAGLSFIDKNIYRLTRMTPQPKMVMDSTYNLLIHSEAAIVASGTATLEAALFNIPQVVCYRANPISAWIVKRVIKVPFVSLVNLLSGKEILKELLQEKFTPVTLRNELTRLLGDTGYRKQIQEAYLALNEKLGPEGASARSAEMICQWTREGK